VAFGILEEALTKQADQVRAERPPGIMRLLQWASEQGIVRPVEFQRFRQWVGLRNRAVHTSESIDPDAAQRAISDIEAVLGRLS